MQPRDRGTPLGTGTTTGACGIRGGRCRPSTAGQYQRRKDHCMRRRPALPVATVTKECATWS
jgi:hypothetical protein